MLDQILLIAEPFSQEVLFYHSCERQTANASIPTSNGCGFSDWGEHQVSLDAVRSQVGLAMYAPQFIQTTAFCPTGNCTWSPYSTIGVCGSCADMTSSMKLVNSTCNVTVHENATNGHNGRDVVVTANQYSWIVPYTDLNSTFYRNVTLLRFQPLQLMATSTLRNFESIDSNFGMWIMTSFTHGLYVFHTTLTNQSRY